MYPYPPSVTPALRTHVEAQASFFNDMSKSMFRSFQQLCDLNIQLAQTMFEENAIAGHHLLTADRQTDMISATASRAQPATDKLRAYQQHIAKMAADAQVELARVAEQHVQETTRTARALADEVQRMTTEETERNMRSQQENMRKFTDPFQHADHAYMRGNGNGNAGVRASASMQSSTQSGSQQSGHQPDVQSGAVQAGSGVKPGGATRKDS